MARSLLRTVGSTLSLVGAFAVGGVLHGVLVTGEIETFSPLAVGGAVVGVGLIVAGLALERRFDPSEYVPEAETGDDGEFDEDLSPVPEGAMADYETDEGDDDR
jgi:hypothetical protein